MKDRELKTYHSAVLLKGYFFDRELPDPIRKALDHLCDDIQSIMADVNQIVEADMARDEMERNRKRAERDAKKTHPEEKQEVKIEKDPDRDENSENTPESTEITPIGTIEPEKKPRKPMSEEHKQKLRDSLARARNVKNNKIAATDNGRAQQGNF
jgi:hypothetical protein